MKIKLGIRVVWLVVALLSGRLAQANTIIFSRVGGFFDQPIDLTLQAGACEVYYTLDGTAPSKRSKRFQHMPLVLTETTIVRAVAYCGDKPGAIASQTYFIQEPPTQFPVVSLGITPWILFDRERGLFMQGSRAIDSLESKPGANFWTQREVSISTEIYEANGEQVYNSQTGFRLFGGMSRLFPQKSMALIAREQYGEKRFYHPFFGAAGPDAFKFLILRNSGSDYSKSHFRDALITGLVRDWDVEVQAARPVLVYLNGKYWGIYNLREKINRYFIAAHHEVDKDSLDIIEHLITRKRGSKNHYLQLLEYLRTHSLKDPANYAYVQSQMEVMSFLDFQLAQIYFDNRDAGGNIRYWRPQRPDGRWRWILYDMDWGMGLYDKQAHRFNSLAFHTEPRGPTWPNPPWSTFILRKLLENAEFQELFLNRFSDYLNTTLRSANVEAHIDRFYEALLPEMPRHLQRWRLKQTEWEAEVAYLRLFARERPAFMWQILEERFQRGPLQDLVFSANLGGRIRLNDHFDIGTEAMHGRYFSSVPIHLEAKPHYGYRFVRWEGIPSLPGQRWITIRPDQVRQPIRAIFERYEHPLARKLMINEISPNNQQGSDWVEIFNNSDIPVDLSDWLLVDNRQNQFHIPLGTFVAPNDYLIICQDSLRFFRQFPTAYNVRSGLSFGVNKVTETLLLLSADGAIADSVGYAIPPTDSLFTLSLLLPQLDNGNAENWRVNSGTGTPNAPNPYYVESIIRYRQTQWIQMGIAGAVVMLCLLLLVYRRRLVVD